jgi:hypothetical protein
VFCAEPGGESHPALPSIQTNNIKQLLFIPQSLPHETAVCQ